MALAAAVASLPAVVMAQTDNWKGATSNWNNSLN